MAFDAIPAATVLHTERNPHRLLATRIRLGLALKAAAPRVWTYAEQMALDTVRDLPGVRGKSVEAILADCDRLAPAFDAEANARALTLQVAA